MATIFYPAIVERAAEGYSVFFPDLPGCTSAGRTLQEAAYNAEKALTGHLLVSAQNGDAVPQPSELDTIKRASEVEVARILVPAERPGRIIRICVTLDEGLVATIDKVASNRSRFLAEAARASLAQSRVV